MIPFRELQPITIEQLRAYAEASGDRNPIHLDEKAAQAAGLPGIIAHGMLSAGFLADRAEGFMREESGAPAVKLKRFQVRFKTMTALGDRVSVGGEVKSSGAGGWVLELVARNQREEVTTTAVAEFI